MVRAAIKRNEVLETWQVQCSRKTSLPGRTLALLAGVARTASLPETDACVDAAGLTQRIAMLCAYELEHELRNSG